MPNHVGLCSSPHGARKNSQIQAWEAETPALILLVASKPSSWLSSSSMVRCTSLSPPPPPLSVRALPMLSTSSMKMMLGACSLRKAGQNCQSKAGHNAAASCTMPSQHTSTLHQG